MLISRCNAAGFRLLLGLALVVATWFALTPQPMQLPPLAHADKWTHLGTFLILAFLVDASWPERAFDPAKWGPLLVYGLAIELIQMTISSRFFSLADLLADAAGIALYGLLARPVLRAAGMR
jgi:VanZ family protein